VTRRPIRRVRGAAVVRRAHRAFAGLAALGLGIAWGRAAAAQPAPSASATSAPHEDPTATQAQADYDAGRLLLRDHADAAALIRFRKSYALRRDPKVLANVALCEKNLNHPAQAATVFAQVLAGDVSSFGPEQREQLGALLSASLAGTGHLRVTVAPWPAVVQIDDQTVAASDLTSDILVDAGLHHVRVWKDGYRPLVRDVTVPPSGRAVVDAELQIESRPEAPRSPSVESDHRVPTWIWVAGGVILGAFVFVAADSVFQ
jgi:hypothetical protein